MARNSLANYVQNIDADLERAFNAMNPAQVQQPPPEETQRSETPVAVEEPAPVVQAQQPSQQAVPPAPPEGGVPPAPQATPPVDEIAELKAEIQRLKSEAGRTKELAKQLRDMKAAMSQPSAPAPIEQKPYVNPLSEDERLALGDDVAKTVSRVAGSTDEALRQTNERLLALEEADHKRNVSILWRNIGDKFGGEIFEMGKSEKYSAWCDKIDPVTGKRNGTLLTSCADALNQKGVEALLNNCIQETGWKSQPQNETPAATVPSSETPSQQVEKPAPRPAVSASANVQVVTPPNATPQARIYTRAEVNEFEHRYYKDAAWRNSPEGKATMADIFGAAVYEGRIQQ